MKNHIDSKHENVKAENAYKIITHEGHGIRYNCAFCKLNIKQQPQIP